MAVMTPALPQMEDASTTLSREGILSLIEKQAALVGKSGREAIAEVKRGTPVHGYIWDDISLLVALLSE
jgi:hypothetical protein